MQLAEASGTGTIAIEIAIGTEIEIATATVTVTVIGTETGTEGGLAQDLGLVIAAENGIATDATGREVAPGPVTSGAVMKDLMIETALSAQE